MDVETRIHQFAQMAEADPENELGHFSLGKALLEADRAQDAIAPLKRAIELNANMSKAYQLLAQAQDQAGERTEAVSTANEGVKLAGQQGDRIPLQAMIDLLTAWGEPVPEQAVKARDEPATAAAGAEGFHCCRCSRPGGKLPKAPFKGALGEKVFEHVCANCWQEWIGMGTKVINELGLVMSRPECQKTYDEYMMEFLMLEDR